MLDRGPAGTSPRRLERDPASRHPQRGPRRGTGSGFVLLPSLIKPGWEALLDVPSMCSSEASPSGA